MAKPAQTTVPGAKTEPAKPAEAAKPATDTSGAKPATADAAKPAAQPKRGGRLVWGRPFDIQHFDTSLLLQSQEFAFLQVFSTLIRLDKEMKPQPELAESWNLSGDSRRLEIQLRKGATFHNGREVTADDVVATILRYQDPKTAANIRPQILRFKDPKALDKSTVEIRFDAPMANVYDALDLMFIWDKENFDDLKQKPNGSGPFKLAEWSPGDKLTLRRHEGYYKSGRPYLDEIVVRTLPDPEALLVALQTGTVDLANPLRPRDRQQLRSNTRIQSVLGPPGILTYQVLMNTSRQPFGDKRVRQAVAWAVNRQRFVDTYMAGLGEPWSLPWPPSSPAYDAALNKQYSHDPDRAKRLLAEAGLPSGFETSILATRSRPGYAELAEQIQSDFAQVGIRARIELAEEAVWRTKTNESDFDIHASFFRGAHKHPASASEQAVAWRATGNSAKFESADYKRLVEQAGTTFDPAESKRVYDQLNRLILDEVFLTPIAPNITLWGHYDYVKGWGSNLEDWATLEDTWLDK